MLANIASGELPAIASANHRRCLFVAVQSLLWCLQQRRRWRRPRCPIRPEPRRAQPGGHADDNPRDVSVAGPETVRPPQQYTSALKRQQLREFGYADRHLGALRRGPPRAVGSGWSTLRSRQPMPEPQTDGWNADLKDELEAVLSRLVCSGRVPLAEAQQAIATDWTAAYNP